MHTSHNLQDTITDECREAYNSLVEKPSNSLHRVNYEIANLKNTLQFSSSTSALPTNKTVALGERDPAAGAAVNTNALTKLKNSLQTKPLPLAHTTELKVPNVQAPRPSTLPGRNSTASKSNRDPNDSQTNPLHILRDKNFRIIRPRMKVNSVGVEILTTLDGSSLTDTNQDEACESPSYLTNTQYTFSERDVNIHHSDAQKFIANKEIENLNPIPLPPRDRNKVLLTNVKRHVRKHPLIIPASGLQRTLNKVTTQADDGGFSNDHDEIDSSCKSPSTSLNKINYNMTKTSTKPAEVMKLKPPLTDTADHFYINQTDINIVSKSDEQKSYSKKFIENNFMDGECRTYENLDSLRLQVDNTDSASLHFESILESDINHVGDVNSGDSLKQRFLFDNKNENYDIPRIGLGCNTLPAILSQPFHTTELSHNEQRRHSNDIEQKKLEFSQKFPNYAQPKDELADNALFNKFRDSFDTNEPPTPYNDDSGKDEASCDEQNQELTEGKLKDSNSVSCEDLLEFADKKPKGKERGIESDEVRIMSKVLGTIVST